MKKIGNTQACVSNRSRRGVFGTPLPIRPCKERAVLQKGFRVLWKNRVPESLFGWSRRAGYAKEGFRFACYILDQATGLNGYVPRP